MPELPEVETIARTLAPQIVNTHIGEAHIIHKKTLQAGENLLPFLLNSRIHSVFRRGKLLLLGIIPHEEVSKGQHSPATDQTAADDRYLPKDIPLFMAFHLKMTGRFFVHPPCTPPLKHTRIAFDLLQGSREEKGPSGRLFFDDIRTFGYCRIMRPQDFSCWNFWKTLGPEPLDSTSSTLATRLKSKKTTIKTALLDQKVIAGVGNIYADESLFRAGILPEKKACEIPHNKLKQLALSLQTVLQQSINECGSSIRDYRDAKGNAGAFQNSFFVYGRKGEACNVCGSILESTRIAGRGTVYCASCQK